MKTVQADIYVNTSKEPDQQSSNVWEWRKRRGGDRGNLEYPKAVLEIVLTQLCQECPKGAFLL